ncbi:nuclear body protein SP140-like protein isoform X3 [Ctenopharyngodon idella]|uniref:nuclear body protein SP140-like protein isoform X3 n=1 Tax=Ctenopharyngodon idella TaxID=7959 RepID=UPI0022318D0C|nr:nuclear body protein SP140-like protein isoform X3 [Ctenopharyngodon idella]
MERESITDAESESESESEWDPESSTEYDSLSENDREKKGKRGGKRKMRKRMYSSQSLRQTIENKLELPVTCGAKDGVLYVEKYNDLQACIFSEGQWFKPSDFERFGGKARSKKWRNSIFYNDIPLQELIKDGFLSPFKKCGVQNKQNDSPESSPVTDRLRKRKYVAQIDSPESSPVTDRLRKRKCRRQLFDSESEESINGSEDGDGDSNDGNEVFDLDDDDDDDDVIDMSKFEGSTLPVTCGSDSGILHKYRFANGHRGRCIRTENFWLTPEDFIRLNKPDGTWRKDIVTYGIPLGKLIMKRVLEPHMINCDCEICEIEQDQYLQNDDVCFVCDSGGDLVCCDECPRAFHSHCHLPAADGDSLGKWSCTFCVMKKTEDSSQKTQQEVLSSPVSQYTLHCQYLLLHLLHESMTDPCTNVSGYSKNIYGPMMLGRVKLNLENNDYQTVQEFVSDIEQIFNNCCTSSGDNDSSKMNSRLKEAFKKEFKTVFKLL